MAGTERKLSESCKKTSREALEETWRRGSDRTLGNLEQNPSLKKKKQPRTVGADDTIDVHQLEEPVLRDIAHHVLGLLVSRKDAAKRWMGAQRACEWSKMIRRPWSGLQE